ncbi:unnamed protein product [Moneuplotes crassus]|uniref:Uncharacterized protein n=3 Tax=Euplotes crassus TaxID=5936 RepID=A0AAD1Y5J2_EUPCR|nr:unnamed protein product [Moneuplotes crassus]
MHKSNHEAGSKGLETKTIGVIRDRLEKSYKENREGLSCYFDTNLEIGWVLYEANIFIYNHKNVFFDMKLPTEVGEIKADQIIISNTENNDFLLISSGKTFYSRIVNQEFDVRYATYEAKTLDEGEAVTAFSLISSPLDNIPSVVFTTTNGKTVTAQLLMDEDFLKLDELVLEPPKKFFKPLTSFFTSKEEEETNVHKIYSETHLKNKLVLYTIGEKIITIWGITTEGTDVWSINVQNCVKRYKSIPGEILTFKIIGDEIIEREVDTDPIMNILVQVVYKKYDSEKHYTQYLLLRYSIDTEAKRFRDFPTDPLLEAEKEFKQEDEQVKCLVVTNIGTVTYIFLCFPTHTRVMNLFSEDIEMCNLKARIIGGGILIDKNVRNYLLFSDREIIIFSLIREHSFKTLNKFFLKEIEKANSQRRQIHEANLEGLPRVQSEDEMKILEMIKSNQEITESQTNKSDLISMQKSHGNEAFYEILMNVTKILIDDPIKDSMVCDNQREEIKAENSLNYTLENPELINWSLTTKQNRVSVIRSFLEQAGFDFNYNLNVIEEKLVFFKSIKKSHDELSSKFDNYQSIVILNQTIQNIVQNFYKISRREIRQKGNTSSLIFYSHPIKGSDSSALIGHLAKTMFDHMMQDGLQENTLLYITQIVLDAIKEVQKYRDKFTDYQYRHHAIFWTMDSNSFIDPVKRIIDMIPEQIRLNQSARLNDRLYELSDTLLRELDHAREIEEHNSHDTEYLEKFKFVRGQLIVKVEEFSLDYALDLAEKYEDIENTTRFCIELGDYSKIYSLIENQTEKSRSDVIQKSMKWIVDDYLAKLKKRNQKNSLSFKFQVFDIYQGKYDDEIDSFLDSYPRLRLIFNLRRGEFDPVHNQARHLANNEDKDSKIKGLLTSIADVNEIKE